MKARTGPAEDNERGIAMRPPYALLRAVAVLCTVLLPATISLADTLYMKNGDRITGTVNRVWDNELFIETAYADEFAVALEDVERIASSEEFEVELRDHSVVTGRFTQDPDLGMSLVTEAGTLPLPPMAIEELITAEEEEFDWEARSDFSYAANTGNTDTINFLWQAAGEMKIGDHRDRVNFSLDRNDQDGETTKEQYTFDYVHSWFFRDSWFATGGVGYERDPIRDLSYRITPGAGVGYQFFDDAYRSFEVAVAAVGVRERLGEEETNSLAPRWSLRYRREILDGDLEFFHNHTLSSYVSGRDNNLVSTATGFRWDIWRDIYLNVQFDWHWESDPAAGRENEDIAYRLGFGVELD
jgi:putative salt-induced outer membrane protein YdiY